MPRGKPEAISLGPGYLYIAVLGTTEPTDLTTPWASVSANWIHLGYTTEGSTFTYTPSAESVVVAEELDPVARALTGREFKMEFALAQLTATNLKVAMNGGTITAGSGIVTFEPPDLGEELRTMLGWESEDHQERWVLRRCLQTGASSIGRRKGADRAAIGVSFDLEKPSGAKPFKAILSSPTRL